MKEIGERLREFRQSKKMKQVEISKILGISVPAYSKIETGENELSTKHLLTLKREFEISVDWLLFGERPNHTKAFGNNEEDVKNMLVDMTKSKTLLFSILSHYYDIIDELKTIAKKKIKTNCI